MAAKIKSLPDPKNIRYRHKPRSISTHAFEKAYWPYLPLILIVGALLALNVRGGSLQPKATPATATVSTASSSSTLNVYLADTNAARTADQLKPLGLNPELQAAAQAKANDMASRDYWSHDTPEGNTPWAFVSAQGYSYQKLAENLAAGFTKPSDAINAWMASPTYRQNILDSSYTDAGFGVAYNPNYTAAGKGPMFIVVAFYGRPTGAPSTAGSANNASVNLTSNTSNPSLGNLTSAPTSRAQLALAWLPSSNWATDAAFAVLIAAGTVWVTHNIRRLKRAGKKGQRFVVRHLWLDAALIAIIVLSYTLVKTAGFIQ